MSRKEKQQDFINRMADHVMRQSNGDSLPETILIKLLKISPEARTEEDLHLIKEYLKNVNYFKSLILGDDFATICRNIGVERLEDSEILFEKGELSNAAYIIITGEIDVLVEGDQPSHQYLNAKKIMSLDKGTLFGEIGLSEEGSTRTATCVSSGLTYLGIINREHWNLIDKDNTDTTQISQDLHSLGLNRGLKTLSRKELIHLYDISVKEKVTSQTIVFEEGDFIDGLYIILSGKAMITKSVKIDGEVKTLEIERIEKGDMIGDYCFVFKEELPYSVVSIYPMRLLNIPLNHVKTNFSDDQLMSIVDSVRLYPNEEDIKRIYLEKIKWAQYSEDVTLDIQNSKKIAVFKTLADTMARYRIPPIYKPKLGENILEKMNILPSLEIPISKNSNHRKTKQKKGASYFIQKNLPSRFSQKMTGNDLFKEVTAQELEEHLETIEAKMNQTGFETNLKILSKYEANNVPNEIPEHVDEVISMGQNVMRKIYIQRELMDEIEKGN